MQFIKDPKTKNLEHFPDKPRLNKFSFYYMTLNLSGKLENNEKNKKFLREKI